MKKRYWCRCSYISSWISAMYVSISKPIFASRQKHRMLRWWYLTLKFTRSERGRRYSHNDQRCSWKTLRSKTRHSRYLEWTLRIHISDFLTTLKNDNDLFKSLLSLYSSRLRTVKSASDCHTLYWFYSLNDEEEISFITMSSNFVLVDNVSHIYDQCNFI